MQLSWGVPSVANGIILNYTVIYSNTTYYSLLVYSIDTFKSRITYLNEDTIYNFTIYANTSAGAGTVAVNNEIRTLENRK